MPPGLPLSPRLLILVMAALASVATSTTFSTRFPRSSPRSTTSSTWPPDADVQTAASVGAARCDLPTWCPPPCPVNITSSTRSTPTTQCLYYLQESHKEEVCGGGDGSQRRKRRKQQLQAVRMKQCCEHAVDEAVPEEAFGGGDACRALLDRLLEVDRAVAGATCGIRDLLTRYDCEQSYSIVHTCQHCEDAYRRWVCSSLVPHYSSRGGQRVRVRPCLSVCQDVEQQCPYLLPQDWTNTSLQTYTEGETVVSHGPTPQYAGEPTFLCLDPNIPEQGRNSSSGSAGDEDCCYTHCGSAGRGATQEPAGHGPIQPAGRGPFQPTGLCEHCPGRPSTSDDPPDGSSSNGGAPPRTPTNRLLCAFSVFVIVVALLQARTERNS